MEEEPVAVLGWRQGWFSHVSEKGLAEVETAVFLIVQEEEVEEEYENSLPVDLEDKSLENGKVCSCCRSQRLEGKLGLLGDV